MKSSRIWFIIQLILISSSIIAFIIEMFQISPQKPPGWLFGFSLISFLTGMIIYVFRLTKWYIGVGFCLFLLLLTIAIGLSGANNQLLNKFGGIGVPFSIFFFIAWVFWFMIWNPKRKKNNLIKNGISAPGILVHFENTGTNIEENGDFPKFQINLTIKVNSVGTGIYQAVASEMLAEHEFAKLYVGMPVQIRYNPNNPLSITVESW